MNNKTIKVSSIIYVKNGEKYIEQCLRSVMNQTLREIEIIVADGGSTDKTLEIIKRLKKEDNRIRLINCAGSVGVQFNTALKYSKGEYIAVCEGDDYILPDKYEKQYIIASEHKIDILRACHYQFLESKMGEIRYKVKIGIPEELYDKVVEIKNDSFLSLGINGFWSGLYSKKFLIDNGIRMNETKGASYQDVTFSFFSQLYAKRVWFMKEAFYCYRIDNLNASVNSDNCIEMNMNEYKLLKNKLEKRNLWLKYQYMFMAWEIGSYKHFVNKISSEKRIIQLERIYENLINQNIPNDFENVNMSADIKKIIKALYLRKKDFFENILENKEHNKKCMDYFKGKGRYDKEIILFGAGHIGGLVYDFLSLSGKKIYIVDNNVELQKRGFRGEKVYNPDNFLKGRNNTIIVANFMHANEICDQLKQLGILEENIVVCNNEDLFLRKVFVELGEEYGIK